MQDDPGLVFDRVAEAYDRVRPAYPPALVDAACSSLALERGSHVLEIGCGTGKLTRALVDRGLTVEAVDPGPQMIAVARANVPEPTASFRLGRFEDVDLPATGFDGAFSATAFHWVDPVVGWSKVAALLRPGAGLALLTHTIESEPGLIAAWREVWPEAASWATRDPETLWEGAEARRGNLSEVWSWLVKNDLARLEVADLFGDVEIHRVPVEVSATAEELLAVIRTQSLYLRFDRERQLRLEDLVTDFVAGQGGTYRSSTFAVAAVARRS